MKDYTELVATASEVSGDVDAVNYASSLVSVLEAKLSRSLKVRQAIESRKITSSNLGTINTPDDFVELVSIFDGEKRLPALPLDAVMGRVREGYSIMGSKIYTTKPGRAYLVQYYAKLPPLRDVGCNWLLLEAPDIYLYGLVAEIAAKNFDQKASAAGVYLDQLVENFVSSNRQTLTSETVYQGARP